MARTSLLVLLVLIARLRCTEVTDFRCGGTDFRCEGTDFRCGDDVTCRPPSNHTLLFLRNLTIPGVRIQDWSEADEITELTLDANLTLSDWNLLCNFRNLSRLSISGVDLPLPSNFSWDCMGRLTSIHFSCYDPGIVEQMLLLPGLQHLTGLCVPCNSIPALNATLLDYWPHLQTLDASHNKIRRLGDSIFANTTAIRHLAVKNNEISDINPRALSPLRRLETLNVAANNISNISFLNSLPDTLIKLDLSNNQIQDMSGQDFEHLINLHSLNLGSNRLTEVTADVFACHLGKVKLLRLDGNNIEILHNHVFAGLDKLELLNISHNELQALHHALFATNASDANCGEQPAKTHGMFKYKVGEASQNTVTKVSEESRAWQHLHTIDASYNKISEISTPFFSHQLAKVQIIDFSHNRLQQVPKLEHLLLLHSVDLSHNNINWLDVGVFNNPKLRVIDLSHNHLTKIISMAFLYLPALSHLDLGHNKINYIYKMAFYRTCKHGQAMTVDMSDNRLRNDAVIKLLNCFKHLQDTACTVTIGLQNNDLSRLLQQPSASMHLHLQQHNDARFFKTWDHVQFSVVQNQFTCDCKLISDIKVFEEMHDRFHADFIHPNFLRFWQNATCQSPKTLQGLPVVNFYEQRSNLCHEEYVCPTECDCVPHSDHTFINCSYRGLKNPPRLLLPGPKMLDLQGNHFDKLSSLRFEQVQSINLSFCHIRDISNSAWGVLQQIPSVELHGNLLRSLPVRDSCVSSLSLRLNPLECGCSNTQLMHWLINCSDSLKDFDNIRCSDGTFFLDLYGEPCLPAVPVVTSVVLTTAAMCATFLLGVLVIMGMYYYRKCCATCPVRNRKWSKVHADEYDKYNLTIIHSPADQGTVVFGILPLLRNHGQYACACLQYSDWRQNAQRFMRNVRQSSAVILVSSRHFANNLSADEEFGQFMEEILSGGSPTICVVTMGGESTTPFITPVCHQLRYNAVDFRAKVLSFLELESVCNTGTSLQHCEIQCNNEKY